MEHRNSQGTIAFPSKRPCSLIARAPTHREHLQSFLNSLINDRDIALTRGSRHSVIHPVQQKRNEAKSAFWERRNAHAGFERFLQLCDAVDGLRQLFSNVLRVCKGILELVKGVGETGEREEEARFANDGRPG